MSTCNVKHTCYTVYRKFFTQVSDEIRAPKLFGSAISSLAVMVWRVGAFRYVAPLNPP